MISIHRYLGFVIRKTDKLLRPHLFRRQRKAVLKAHPELEPLMDLYAQKYIQVEYSAHDQSLMERIHRKIAYEDQYIYGSTPWKVFMTIAERLDISPKDVFVELGCGTGHLCFYMNKVHGIKSVGIEALAHFVAIAKEMKKSLEEPPHHWDLKQLYFYNLDFLTFDISQGSLFYMAGTCFPDDFRDKIIQKMKRDAPHDSRLITLTHAIVDPQFLELDQFEAIFSWGRDKVFIYKIQAA